MTYSAMAELHLVEHPHKAAQVPRVDVLVQLAHAGEEGDAGQVSGEKIGVVAGHSGREQIRQVGICQQAGREGSPVSVVEVGEWRAQGGYTFG